MSYFVYTRRWERWLAKVWPPRRRKLAMMNKLGAVYLSDIQLLSDQIRTDIALYGTAYVKRSVTENGTSVESEPDDPQNTGSKPEGSTYWSVWSPVDRKKS